MTPHTSPAWTCGVCGVDCRIHYDPHLSLRPREEPMPTHIVTPKRIIDTELERVVYGAGARVPIDDAVRYGLIDEDAIPEDAPDGSVVVAERIIDNDVLVASPGDVLTAEEAEALGVDDTGRQSQPAEKRRGSKRSEGPNENRQKQPSDDRTKPPSQWDAAPAPDADLGAWGEFAAALGFTDADLAGLDRDGVIAFVDDLHALAGAPDA